MAVEGKQSATAPSKQKEVPSLLDELSMALSILDDNTIELDNRLAHARRSEPSIVEPGRTVDPQTDMGNYLAVLVTKARAINARVVDNLNTLEI